MRYLYQFQREGHPDNGFYYESDVDLTFQIGVYAPVGSDYASFVPVQSLPDLPLEVERARAIDHVNRSAGTCRSKYITVAPGQEATYIMKEQEARAWLADPTTPALIIGAEAGACGMSMAEVATLVVTTADQWRMLAASIEGIRRGAIVAIEKAQTVAEVRAIQPVFP